MRREELDNIASNYHLKEEVKDKFIEDISQYHFCDWIKKQFSPNLSVCEMGYGEGITAKKMGGYFRSYSVVEGAASLCKKAREENENIEVVHSFFEEYIPAQKFDLILALHVLEHVDSPKMILDKIIRWLKPNGCLVALVPNKQSLHRVFALNMGLIDALDSLSERDILVGHQRVYDISELKNELERAHFSVIKEAGFFLKSLPNSMMVDHKPELIWELNKISEILDPSILANICVVARINDLHRDAYIS
jgi:SAM-dependent methyltransferase